MQQSRPAAVLFTSHRSAVMALFRSRGFSPWESEDLAQETFLKAHQSLSAYRGDAPIEHWLIRIATNTARAKLRFRAAARRAAHEVPLDQLASKPTDAAAVVTTHDPLRHLLAEERGGALHAAVNRLPGRMRRCVRLLLEQDLPYREIARRLCISEQTVKVQLMRARGQLKVLLREMR